jgi:KDO2-lipid IV(A) lauroyltransferase
VRRPAQRSMEHAFGMFLVDVLVTPRLITPSTWSRYIELKEVQPVVDQFVRGDPMILVTGHCGNWEIAGHVFAMLGFPVHAIARPLDNPLLNRWLLGLREARGTRIITKWGATPVLVEALRAGGRLSFIADQDAGEKGLFVPFFGRLASSYKSIALLAMRHEVPIVAGFARRLDGRLRYDIECTDIIRPDDWADEPDPLFYITARYNRAIEAMIVRAPEQYLWLYRRWRSRPKHERQGRPIPRRLLEQIERLPWMTGEELARLASPAEPVSSGSAHA